MKKVLLSIFTIIALISCKEQNAVGPMILSGKIEYPRTDSIGIIDQARNVIRIIKLAKDDTIFADTFRISTGFYNFLYGQYESTSLFLKSGFDLNMVINSRSFDKSLIYTGKGANENNFLAKKIPFEMSLGKIYTAKYLYTLNEENYLKLVDSLYNVRVNRLKNAQLKFDKDFEFGELKNYELYRLNQISSYEASHQVFTNNKDFKVSTQYPDPFKSLDINNEQLLMCPGYLQLIKSYVYKKAKTLININDSSDFHLEIMNVVGNEIKNQKVRESISCLISMVMLDNTNELDKVYEKLTSFISDNKSLNGIKVQYERLKKMEKGNPSPDFSFHDINNQHITLSSLKGKLVYIDIWATWCTPCLAENPALKQLEEDLNNYNIQFIRISIDQDRERWLKMIKEQKLGGIQIYAGDEPGSFFDDFMLVGIPRYILLDKNGFIVDSNAKRPSNPKLKEELLTLLQN